MPTLQVDPRGSTLISCGGSIFLVGKRGALTSPLSLSSLLLFPSNRWGGKEPPPPCPPTPGLPRRLLPTSQWRATSAQRPLKEQTRPHRVEFPPRRPLRPSALYAPAEFLRVSIFPPDPAAAHPLGSPSSPARGVSRWEGRAAIHLDLFQLSGDGKVIILYNFTNKQVENEWVNII